MAIKDINKSSTRPWAQRTGHPSVFQIEPRPLEELYCMDSSYRGAIARCNSAHVIPGRAITLSQDVTFFIVTIHSSEVPQLFPVLVRWIVY